MKNFLNTTTCCVIVSMIISFSSCTAQAPQGNLKTDMDSLSYLVGVSAAQGLDQYLMQMGIDISGENKADFVKGLLEGVSVSKDDLKAIAQAKGKDVGLQAKMQMVPAFSANFFADGSKEIDETQFLAGFVANITKENLIIDEVLAHGLVESLLQKVKSEANQKYQAENAAFLEENKKDPDVVVLPSGLQYKILKQGNGPKPTTTDTVRAHYIGKNIRGEEFDSSIDKEPIEFRLTGGVIAGWIEGVQLMPVGSKYILYIPYDLAYGEDGRPGAIDPYATLIFEIDLLEIVK